MKEVYVLRHAEKGLDGSLTENGKTMAQELGRLLPLFSLVYSSPSDRAQLTAQLLTGRQPNVDDRANFFMATPTKSTAINALSSSKSIPFLDAVQEFGDSEVLNGIDSKATELNSLVNELLSKVGNGEKALIVSHDLSISPAMSQRAIPLTSIDYLSGYVINEIGEVTTFPKLGSNSAP